MDSRKSGKRRSPPYPGYTREGPTEFILDVEAYRREGLDPLLGIRCRCGFTIDQATLYVSTWDRWRPPEYFCPVCMPYEFRSLL